MLFLSLWGCGCVCLLTYDVLYVHVHVILCLSVLFLVGMYMLSDNGWCWVPGCGMGVDYPRLFLCHFTSYVMSCLVLVGVAELTLQQLVDFFRQPDKADTGARGEKSRTFSVSFMREKGKSKSKSKDKDSGKEGDKDKDKGKGKGKDKGTRKIKSRKAKGGATLVECGRLLVDAFELRERPSFLDFIRGGTQVRHTAPDDETLSLLAIYQYTCFCVAALHGIAFRCPS